MKTLHLKNCEKNYFLEAWELYENSFPKEEKRTLAEQETILKDERYNPTIFIKDDEVVAILFFWKYSNHTFIEHFAISQKLRGQSYGLKILEEFLENHKNVVLEIEPIFDEITQKRFDFYKRFDFIINDYKHFQIPFRKDAKELELLILSHKNRLEETEYEKLYFEMKNSLTV